MVYPGSAKCGFWKGIDSEPPYQSARYLTLPKSVILQTPDIPPRVAQSLHHKTRVPPRSWAIYIGVQNYKSSKSSAPPQTREPDARRLFREVLPIGGMPPRVYLSQLWMLLWHLFHLVILTGTICQTWCKTRSSRWYISNC